MDARILREALRIAAEDVVDGIERSGPPEAIRNEWLERAGISVAVNDDMVELEPQGRGRLTQRIKARSLELLGYEIDQTELRLLPYIVHVLMNKERIDPNKISGTERGILSKWEKAGHISRPGGGVINITADFWFIACEILLLGYVDLDE